MAGHWKPWQKWFVLYIHDFAFRFLCTAAGFVALCFAVMLGNELLVGGSPTAPESAMFIFLSLVGLIGVGGQLHYAILLGKVPK
jgi:hypothetical protein